MQVTKILSGIIVIEQKQVSRAKFRVANWIAEVETNKPLWIFASTFYGAGQLLPKKDCESPIRLTEITTAMGREIDKCRNIVD